MTRWIPVIILIAAAVLIAGCSDNQQPMPPTGAPSPSPSPVATIPTTTQPPTPISQSSVSDNTVLIQDFAFKPQTITVKKGDIVRWENRDAAPHRIVFTDSSGRDTNTESSVLTSSQSYSRKFPDAGTYPYYCKIHPDMKGSVIVE